MRRKRLPKKNHKSNQYSRFRALSVALNLICIQQLSLFESQDDGTRQHKPAALPDRDKLQLVIKDLARPNGLAFSPDEKILYVAESGKKQWIRYRVQSDGTVTEGTLFLDASTDPADGGPDGLRVDIKGNIYGSGPGGVWIISPEGKHIGSIKVPERVSNVAWGDEDGRTLYITASTSLFRVKLKIPGVRN